MAERTHGSLPWNSARVPSVSRAMSKTAEVNDPSYWQRRAQDTRRLASQMQDAVTKETLLEIAKTYERIGAIAQSRRIATPQ
jgi:hypothetical protein